MEPATQTVLVGPRTLRREGVARALASTDFKIVAAESDLLKIDLSGLPKSACLLIVECSHDVGSAIAQIQHFKSQFPGGKVALFADHLSVDELLSAFHAGANAYFINVQTCEVFIKALELVMLGETILPCELLALIDKDKRESHGGSGGCDLGYGKGMEERGQQLSDREKVILQCIIEGDSNKNVGRKLNIAEATVKVHVKAILRKIHVRNRTQAAMWAMSQRVNDLAASKDEIALPPPSLSPANEGGVRAAP